MEEENFGQRLTRLLKEKDIKNNKITNDLKLSKNAIGNYKNNQIPGSLTLYDISQYLGVTMEYLLTGEQRKELTEEEKELLTYFNELPEKEKYKLLGAAEQKAREYKEKETTLLNSGENRKEA